MTVWRYKNDTDTRIDHVSLKIHMLKLKTKVSLLGIVVLWLICSPGRLGTSGGHDGGAHLQMYLSTIRSHFLQVT